MPRDRRAVIGTAIWTEDSIRGLTASQQHAYLLAYTQPNLNRCGVVSYNLRKWSGLARDLTVKKLRAQYEALHQTRHVVLDEDHEELLIRTYIGHDGLLAQPLVVAALVRDWTEIMSQTIRRAILTELRRLWNTDLSSAERAGLLLLLGSDPADVGIAADRPAQADRIRGALGRALSVPMRDAIAKGSVDPFPEGLVEGFPKGLPEGLTEGPAEGPTRTRERGRPRVSPSPSPTPSPIPTPSPAPRAAGSAEPDDTHADQPDPEDLVRTAIPRLPRPVRERLTTAVLELQADGIATDAITAGLTAWAARPGAAPGLLAYLASDAVLGQHQAQKPALSVNGSAPPWCEDPACDPHSRWAEDADGRWARCPRCHPTATSTPTDQPPPAPIAAAGPDDPPF